MAEEQTPQTLAEEQAPDNVNIVDQPTTEQVTVDTPPSEEQAPPEGFASWEEYGKAQHAEKAKAKAEEKPEEAPAEEKPEEPEPLDEDTQKAIAEQVDALPEDIREGAKPLFEEFARTGDLSAEGREAAAKLWNVTPDMVDLYVKGAQAQLEADASPLYEAGGGKEQTLAFKEWAEANYSPEEQAAFNEALKADPEKALKEHVDKWIANGHGPDARDITHAVQTDTGQQNTGPEPFADENAMTAAMADPRYRNDEKYRQEVYERIRVSKVDTSRQY